MSSAPRDTRLVLLVEDDPQIADAITTVLEDDGCRVVAVPNGQEAWDQLEGGLIPSVILLDLMMPVMDGWQFREAQARDQRFAGIPVVVLTAHADARQAALRMGATGWLGKPLDLHDLLATVRDPAYSARRSRPDG